jgi:murein DD-endopeptidase MepM/ murein hydrolase activator NlpD
MPFFRIIILLIFAQSLYAAQEIKGQGQANVLHDSIVTLVDTAAANESVTDVNQELVNACRYPKNGLYRSWNTQSVWYSKLEKAKNLDSAIINLGDSSKASIFCIPHPGHITSPYGYRHRRFHSGVDIDLETGDSVFSAFDGLVRIAGWDPGLGKTVLMRHASGIETAYAHLSKIVVDSNKYVKTGQLIGLGGATGRASGSHLHFEIRYGGLSINPESIIDFKKRKLLHHAFHLDSSYGQNSNALVAKAAPNLESDSILNAQLMSVLDSSQTNVLPKKIIKAEPEPIFYQVKKGDTLYAISKKKGVSVLQLCSLNKLKETSILQIGQKLRIQ